MLWLKNIIKFQIDLWFTDIEEEIRQLIRWTLFYLWLFQMKRGFIGALNYKIQGVIKRFRDLVIENYNLLPTSKNI